MKGLEQTYVDRLKELVKIPSVYQESPDTRHPFGKPIADVLDKMLEICRELGFRTFKDPEGYYGYAETGSGEELFGILGHLDVVPEGRREDWNAPPFDPVLKGDKLYGRGTIDDKGPILAAVFAVKALMDLKVSFKKRIRIIFGTDEETLWRDMKRYREKEEIPAMGFTPDSTFPLVYAEKGLLQCLLKGKNDTSLRLEGGEAFNAVPGSIFYDGDRVDDLENKLKEFGFRYERKENGILVLGKSAHAQVPEKGMNAIVRLAMALYELGIHSKAIDFIYERVKENPYATAIFGEVEDTESGKLKFTIGKIHLEEEEVLSVDMRIPVTAEKETIVETLREAAENYQLEYVEFDYLQPVYVPKTDPLVQTLMEVYRESTGDKSSEPISTGGATYARAIDHCVAFGAVFPDQEKVEHQPNEYIDLEKAMKAMEIYAKAVYRLTT